MKPVIFSAAFIALLLLSVPHLFAQEEEGEVRVNGVVFNIASDRRVEKVGGIYEPEGLDKYFKRYLVEMNARLDRMEAQIGTLNEKLDRISADIAKMDTPPEEEKKETEKAPAPESGRISRKGKNPFL